MPVFGQSVTLRDDKGYTARVSFWIEAATQVAAATSGAAVVADIAAMSNAAVQAVRGASNMSPIGVVYGANAVYEDVQDKARMSFETADGSIHRYEIPAPLEVLFLPDGETVDKSQAAVAAFLTNMLAGTQGVSSRAGNYLTIFLGGVRVRTRNPRRPSIIIRDPTLTNPAE
jgi:hypothetical protein